MLGRTLGHYRIEEQLGAGGMGVVYKARDTRLDRDVAVKIISPESHNPALEEAFRREARLASSLNHPAIVTILDIVDEGDLACIVMEYLAGQTLNYVIPEKGFPVEQALELALQIGGGIAAAHAAGIVHRDLKPGNIVVGPSGRVKILDFGLAKLAEHPQDTTTRNVSVFGDKVVGTIAYMAPEQARGEAVDQRADIFSFGVIFSQMLTGLLPFHAPNPVALIRAMQVSEPTPVRHVRPEIPASLEAITLRALLKDREERFQTMTEMIRALTQRVFPLSRHADASTHHSAVAAARPRPAQPEFNTTKSSIMPPVTGTERTSIAVLPFRSLSADPEDGYLGSGLASEVIGALTGVPGLRVAPQRASFMLSEQASDPMVVARTLNTRYVVTGSLRRADQRLRVAVELVDAIEERVAWAQKYDRKVTDIFDMQEEISKTIVSSVGGHLIRVATDFAYRTPTANLDAWGLVRKAYHIWNYEFSPAGVAQAISMLRRAMELDPGYASAHAYLSMYLMQTVLHGISQRPQDDWTEAIAAAERAGELAPNESEVLASCSLVWLQNGQYEKAVQCLNRAVQIAPFDLVAWGYLGLAHASAGGEKEILEAHRILSQLLEDAPDHPSVPYWLQFLTVANLRLERNEDAVVSARRSVELQPGYTFHQVFYAEALCRAGQKAESLKVLAAIQTYSPGFTLEHFEKICLGFTRSAAIAEKVCGCIKALQNSSS